MDSKSDPGIRDLQSQCRLPKHGERLLRIVDRVHPPGVRVPPESLDRRAHLERPPARTLEQPVHRGDGGAGRVHLIPPHPHPQRERDLLPGAGEFVLLTDVPLDLQQGRGAIIILSGRLSRLFGDDELSRLRQYATSISAGLDRVTLNSRIAALERAKTDFLNIASHELRGPMTVIKGYLTMLDAGALGDVAPKARSVLPLLISKADEVNWMIEQMIEASRLEEGRLALKRHRSDIVELTDSAIEGVKLLLSGHELRVDTPHQPVEAEVDPDRFQIVVRNLLSNAAKYSSPGTDIDIEVRRDGDKAFVLVKDQGIGISKQDQAVLFTRFGRVDSSSHVQGTGLGLWLSREIARMHDGDLTVESGNGAGTTFTFSVPLSP